MKILFLVLAIITGGLLAIATEKQVKNIVVENALDEAEKTMLNRKE